MSGSGGERFEIILTIAVDRAREIDGCALDRFRVAQKKESAGIQCVIKALQQSISPFFGEIHQNVHAKDAVHSSNVYGLGQIHRNE